MLQCAWKLNPNREDPMNRLVLKRPVTISGKNIFGFPAMMRLEPTDKPGWWWSPRLGKDIPITPSIMAYKWRRLALMEYKNLEGSETHSLEIFEHMAFLRVLGLDNVSVISPRWPPYCGSAALYWNAVRKHVKVAGELQPFFLPEQKAGPVRYLAEQECALTVHAYLDYPGYAPVNEHYSFPEDAWCLSFAKTQGWPSRRLYYPLKLASLCGWPHLGEIVWPHRCPNQAMALFAAHRALDMAAVFSFLAPAGYYFVGDLYSHKAGHRDDIELLWRLQFGGPLYGQSRKLARAAL